MALYANYCVYSIIESSYFTSHVNGFIHFKEILQTPGPQCFPKQFTIQLQIIVILPVSAIKIVYNYRA